MKKTQQQRKAYRTRLYVGFVYRAPEAGTQLNELNRLTPNLNAIIEIALKYYVATLTTSSTRWEINKYSGWAVYGRQYGLSVSDELLKLIKAEIKAKFIELCESSDEKLFDDMEIRFALKRIR